MSTNRTTRTVPASQRKQAKGTLWERLSRYSFTRSRLTRQRLASFCGEMATDEYTLVVHSIDVDHRRFFPNSFVVSGKREGAADLHTDRHYRDLTRIPDASFRVILCTGLLEHIPDPERLIQQFHRILQPGGRLILSASAVFAFHGAPENYFHYTPNGLRYLCRDWSHFAVLRGSTQPFETISVLLQRINLQCDVFPPARPLIEALFRLAPLLDSFVLRQYDNHHLRNQDTTTDSFMPATLHAVVVR